MRFVAQSGSRKIRLVQPAKITAVSSVIVERQTGSASTVSDADKVISRTVGTRLQDRQVRVESIGGSISEQASFVSSNPAVATVSGTGFVTHVSDGSATISVQFGASSASLPLTFASSPGETIDRVTDYAVGSLAKSVTDAVDTRLNGKSKATAGKVFLTQDHAAQSYIRNPNLWCADLDLSPVSPWNSSGGGTRAGVLISPRHILFAAHYEISVGAQVRFVSPSGTVVNRTMTAKLTHPSYTPFYPDLTVGVLNSDVPAGISFVKVLPFSWTTKLPSLSFSAPLPLLGFDQEENALVTDLGQIASGYANCAVPAVINAAKRLEFFEYLVAGDSGNPAFLIVGGDLVLVTVWTFGAAGGGTFVSGQISTINSLMTSLGGGYQLTQIDLSSFTTF